MRNMIYYIQFLILAIFLIMGAFILTPSVYRPLDFEYRTYFVELSINKSEAEDEKRNHERAAAAANAVIEQRTRELENLNLQSGRSDGDKASENQDLIASKKVYISEQIATARESLNNEAVLVQTSSAKLDDINKKIDKLSADGNNVYLVIRALSLGAIGALVSAMSKFHSSKAQSDFFELMPPAKLFASLCVGAITSIVAFGLFYTKQISIFHNGEPSSALPEYWRTTILCLLAGAFADRLFNAASARVDHYISTDNRGSEQRER